MDCREVCHGHLSVQTCQLDAARDVYHAYIKPRSSPVRLHLNQRMISDMDQFIQGNKVSICVLLSVWFKHTLDSYSIDG